MKKSFLILAASFACFYTTLQATTEIIFWHAFEGFLLDKFQNVVDDFNKESESYHVSLVYKGNYTETFNLGVQAFEAGCAPHILQVYEVATETMMLKPDIFYPVDTLMHQHHKKFDPQVYIDAVRDFYSTSDGKMCSLPWNASTGILFYNKKAFESAGLDPECPPKTWIEMDQIGKKLVKAGFKGFTTAWPAAYHLEHVSCLHNLPFATQENGYAGPGARLAFNGPFQIRHLDQLINWKNQGIFAYFGRFTNEPEQSFTDEKTAILMQGSNRFSILKKQAKFPIGVGFLPYWPDIVASPYRLNVGGSSFWVMKGFDENTYRGVAKFISFLSLPEVQAYWHQETGYLPITEAAYYLAKKRGFYEQNPAAEIAVLEILGRPGAEYTKGVRLGHYLVVRELIIDYLERALNGEFSAKEAWDNAVERGNQILDDYQQL